MSARIPELSQVRITYPISPYPLWERLDEDSRYALRQAMSHNRHKKLIPPGERPDVLPFDTAREMREGVENHMRATGWE